MFLANVQEFYAKIIVGDSSSPWLNLSNAATAFSKPLSIPPAVN